MIGLPILAVICFFAFKSGTKLGERHLRIQEETQANLKKSGFSIDQHFDLFNTSGSSDISFDFYVDNHNKQIAIYSFGKGNTTRFDFKDIKAVKISINEKNVGNTLPSDISPDKIKRFAISICTHKMFSSPYKIEVFLGECNAVSGSEAADFIHKVSNVINNIAK